MVNIADLTVDQITLFFLCFIRVVSIIVMMPVIGSGNIPMRVKSALSFFIAIALFPTFPEYTAELPSAVFPFAVIAVKEVLVGIVLGFGANMIFVSLQFAGRLVDQQMAFAMVEVIDPSTDVSVTVMGQFKMIIFTLIFLMIYGHHFLLTALADSFRMIPLTEVSIDSGRLSQQIIFMIRDVFILAVKFAAPIMVTLLMTTISLGIIARTVPQMNVFIVGLPLKIGIGLFTAFVSLPLLYIVFQKMFLRLQEDIYILMDCLG
ncbi:MAG: flagellar biosynthetic protein FliR [Fibrobacterota bacterium]